MEHTKRIWRFINADWQIEFGGKITVVEINVNGHWTQQDKHPEVEVEIMDNNRNQFIFTYRKPLIYCWSLEKYLVTPEDKNLAEKVLPGEDDLLVDIG